MTDHKKEMSQAFQRMIGNARDYADACIHMDEQRMVEARIQLMKAIDDMGRASRAQRETLK